MQISDLRSNSAFTYMTLTWELNPGGQDKMWTLLFQRSSAEFGRGERTLLKHLWEEVSLREKGNLPDCRIILETRVDIANAWQTTLPASNWECCREKKTLVLLRLHFYTQNPACSNDTSEVPARLWTHLVFWMGSLQTPRVRSWSDWWDQASILQFFLIVSHLCVIPVAVPALGPHWGQLTEVRSCWCQGRGTKVSTWLCYQVLPTVFTSSWEQYQRSSGNVRK